MTTLHEEVLATLTKKQLAKVCPSEEIEQREVCKWLDLNGVQYFAVPNGGARNKAVAGKLKAGGVKPGIPDIIIVDRPTKCPKKLVKAFKPATFEVLEWSACSHVGAVCPLLSCGTALEMKRMTGGRISPEQREWMRKLEQLSWTVIVGNGFGHAVEQLTALGYARRTS